MQAKDWLSSHARIEIGYPVPLDAPTVKGSVSYLTPTGCTLRWSSYLWPAAGAARVYRSAIIVGTRPGSEFGARGALYAQVAEDGTVNGLEWLRVDVETMKSLDTAIAMVTGREIAR